MTADGATGIRWAAAALLVAGFLIVSRVSLDRPPSAPPAIPPGTPTAITTAAVEPVVIEPVVIESSDPDVVLAELRGRPLVVLVWSPYSTFSTVLLAAVDAAAASSWGTAIGVFVGSDSDSIDQTCRRYGIAWPQYRDTGWCERLGVTQTVPTLAVVDAHGQVTVTGKGYDGETWRRVREAIGAHRRLPGRRVRGRLTWVGRPLAELTGSSPRFWFRDETRYVEAPLSVSYRADDASFTIADVVPGAYGMSVWVGHAGDEPEIFNLWTHFGVPVAGSMPEIEGALVRWLHLRAPVDNTVASVEGLGRHTSPVEIAWDAVAEATSTRVRLTRRPRTPESQSAEETVLDEAASGSHLSLDLAPGWIYTLTVDAYRDQQVIARIWGSGDAWAGSSYRFEVVPDLPAEAVP